MSVIQVPVGPQHPALKEPERFILHVEGENVVKVDVKIGYAHRGIEKIFERKMYIPGVFVAERICGICSAAHAVAYSLVVEKVAEVEPPERAKAIRTIAFELNRIQSHLLWLGILAHELGFDTLFMLTWRDRELVLSLIERLFGNRVTYGVVVPGGVRRDISEAAAKETVKVCEKIIERAREYLDLCLSEKTIVMRTENIGILKPYQSVALCAVGPVARGSAVRFDVREDEPYDALEWLDFQMVVEDGCDTLSRTLVRVKETEVSAQIVKELAKKLPAGPIKIRLPMKLPEGEAVSRVEAPRGELFYYAVSKGGDKPYRMKVRTPTLANIPALCEMLKGCHIADVPVILASIDPCFACMDRVEVVDSSGRRRDLEEMLRRRGV